jgi:hypothetical protein
MEFILALAKDKPLKPLVFDLKQATDNTERRVSICLPQAKPLNIRSFKQF